MAIRRIAVEEAFVTPEIMKEWHVVLAGRNVEPGFAKMGETILAATPGNKLMDDRLLDIGAKRIAHMDSIGIDMQILSLTSPGVQVFEASLATRLAAASNDALAEAVRAYPTRFAGLAAIAPQDPTAAAREIERAAQELKLNGLIVNSHTMGEYLDAEKFWPILEAAQALDMPIYLHPREPAASWVAPYLDYGLWFAGWGFAAETGLHALRLILSGTFDRYPKLKIVLGHMGEGPAVLASAHRQPLFARSEDRCRRQASQAAESVAEAVRFMDGAAVTEDERKQIYATNARRVFKLKA